MVDLTAATVRFHMKDGAGRLKVDAAASVVDAPNGVVEYEWAAGDTDEVGRLTAEWEVTFPDSTVRTFPTGASKTTVIVHGELA